MELEIPNNNNSSNNHNFTSRHQSCRSVVVTVDDWQSSSSPTAAAAAAVSGHRALRRQRRLLRLRRQLRCPVSIGIIIIIIAVGIFIYAVNFNRGGQKTKTRLDAAIQYSHTWDRGPDTASSFIITTRRANDTDTNGDKIVLNNSISGDDDNAINIMIKTKPSTLMVAENYDDHSMVDGGGNDLTDYVAATLPIYLLRPLPSTSSMITTTELTSHSHYTTNQTNTHASSSSAAASSFTTAVPESSASSFEFAQISWKQLSKAWNRTIKYHDLFPITSSSINSSHDLLGGGGGEKNIVGDDYFGVGATFIPYLPFVAAEFSKPQTNSSTFISSSSLNSEASSSSSTTPLLRTIILLHTSPKTGSTTLRASCTHNLQQTCNATQSPSELRHHAPPGYYNETTFFGLVRECVDTHHFCIKDILFFPSSSSSSSSSSSYYFDAESSTVTSTASQSTNSQSHSLNGGRAASSSVYINDNDNITSIDLPPPPTLPSLHHRKYLTTLFIHTFPFRTYDEWVVQALRQQYNRAQEAGCHRTKMLLTQNNCKRDNMELDIRKYSKLRLKNVWRSVVQRLEYWKRMRSSNASKNKKVRSRRGGRRKPTHYDGEEEEEEEEEHHMFLLYQHSELHPTMQILSDLYGIPTLPGLEKRMKVGGQKQRRRKKKEKEETAGATSERRNTSSMMAMYKDDESIAWDEDGSKTTTTRIGEVEEEETKSWCKEEDHILTMFHDCFSHELMIV